MSSPAKMPASKKNLHRQSTTHSPHHPRHFQHCMQQNIRPRRPVRSPGPDPGPCQGTRKRSPIKSGTAASLVRIFQRSEASIVRHLRSPGPDPGPYQDTRQRSPIKSGTAAGAMHKVQRNDTSIVKSNHIGLASAISWFFQSRGQRFNFRSRAMAWPKSSCTST